MKLYLNCVKWKCAILYNNNVVIQTETLVYPTLSYGKNPKTETVKSSKSTKNWL